MIKVIFLAAVIACLGYFYVTAGEENSRDPVYVESRISLTAQSRDFNLVLVGKMNDMDDCQVRSSRAWEKALQSCKKCRFVSTECKTEISGRYMKLFDDQSLELISYLKAESGNKHERDGRIVVWGLSREESQQVCETVRSHLKVNYEGHASCIAGK